MEILSFGDNVKVIKPDGFVTEIKAMLTKALSHY
jgi:predicted DNA-binding transcriptional regulator YafY